ncbi:Hypothetical predicted protein [Xyrichtys novacula]|uniref:Uncharacterized protein n=1 Tax=Xyrichtys novacula TaxID=13765 RepID=A0AAV1EMH8_XYRNO|nr:Hypothetical predicted protein [Xyrichtys novacula]
MKQQMTEFTETDPIDQIGKLMAYFYTSTPQSHRIKTLSGFSFSDDTQPNFPFLKKLTKILRKDKELEEEEEEEEEEERDLSVSRVACWDTFRTIHGLTIRSTSSIDCGEMLPSHFLFSCGEQRPEMERDEVVPVRDVTVMSAESERR